LFHSAEFHSPEWNSAEFHSGEWNSAEWNKNIRPTYGLAPIAEVAAEPENDPLEQAEELLSYGHSEDACTMLREIVEQRPQDAQACTLLCQAYANLGEWVQAERYCQQAIKLDNLMEAPYYTLALVLQHQDNLEGAVKAMKKVVYLNSQSVRGHYGLANLYHSQNLLPQALKALDNARGLLMNYHNSDLVEGTGGITAGSLKQAITQQQQQWSAEATGLKW
jgi:chemotaxis protein methyltransferase CheR